MARRAPFRATFGLAALLLLSAQAAGCTAPAMTTPTAPAAAPTATAPAAPSSPAAPVDPATAPPGGLATVAVATASPTREAAPSPAAATPTAPPAAAMPTPSPPAAATAGGPAATVAPTSSGSAPTGLAATLAGGAVRMVRFPAGSVTIGRDDGPADERPAHAVQVGAFEIDALPVTNADFAAFLEAVGPRGASGQSRFDSDDPDARIRRVDGRWRPDPEAGSHPVFEVSWFGARDYCDWRGARLPTEVEWERAARGTEARSYPWGEAPPDPSRARFAAGWTASVPVGSLAAGATPEGVLDMGGNGWEWTGSLYRPYPYRGEDGREDRESREERATRGGGQDSPADHLRTTYRGRGLSRGPGAGHHNIGFRCARGLT